MTVSELKERYDLALSYYTPEHKRIRLLDAADRGDLWKALAAKFPSYQILPDTNFISYVKSNILASIYTVSKSASIQPTSEKDKDIVTQLNVALDWIWSLCNVGYYQMQAGERAALCNIGITQVGWDESLPGGSSDFVQKGNVAFKNVDPLKFMRDPFAPDLDTAEFCIYYDSYHKSVFQQNTNYTKEFETFLAKQKQSVPAQVPVYDFEKPTSSAKDYYTLVIYWVREGEDINEYHVINNEHLLLTKEKIKPAEFPFAILYCNTPARSIIGASECHKIFANNVAYNLMDSIELTAEYKNQRPPKYVSAQSGLNIAAFNKYGNEADHTFIVNGRADQAVHYHQFPSPSPTLPSIKSGLMFGMQMVSGVDSRYTGRDTGSILTTGGVEDMLNRVTLIDTPKIKEYERYTERLTKLVLSNFLQFAQNRKYFVKDKTKNAWITVDVPFHDIKTETLFNYAIEISSELPKNKARIAQTANTLIEKQMQYGQGREVSLITPEEWLMMQDLPNKEYFLERMGVERMQSAVEDVAQVIFEYSDLVKNGANPQDAVLATAQTLKNKRQGIVPEEPEVPMAMPEDAVPPEEGLPQIL